MSDTPERADSPAERQCPAITRGGTRCQQRAYLNPETHLCLWHDPTRADEAQAARRRGRETSAKEAAEREARMIDAADPPPMLELTLDGVSKQLGWIAQQTLVGSMQPRIARAATYALSQARHALTQADLEVQLKAARAELAKLRTITRRGVA